MTVEYLFKDFYVSVVKENRLMQLNWKTPLVTVL